MATTPQPQLDVAAILATLDEKGKALFEMLMSEGFTDEALQQIFDMGEQYEEVLEKFGPQTRDELHGFLKRELHLDIPRYHVCEDHVAPFTFLADLFFGETEDGEPVDAALLMANRGGSKTFLVALLHWLNSRFKPGCEGCTFGATEAQSLRAYSHLKQWIYDEHGEIRPEIVVSKMRETIWTNGSRVEVLPGTPQAVNGPHPQIAHADEIELMDDETWKESRNMTISKSIPTGQYDAEGNEIMRIIKPQDIATSTRKGPTGRMQELIDEIFEAIKDGYRPPRRFYAWCIFETAAQVKNCQTALGVDPKKCECKGESYDCEHHCSCHKVRKGEWLKEDDGKEIRRPRLLVDICKGRFHRSRGWQPYGDVIKQFTENEPDVWVSQQECREADRSNYIIPNYREELHALQWIDFDPNNGDIFLAVDWGGTNPHAVNWYQRLDYAIDAKDYFGEPVTIPEGATIVIDEIYWSEIGNVELGNMVIDLEDRLDSEFAEVGGFNVYERYADPQGKSARRDWAMSCKRVLKCSWHTTREKEEQIKDVNSMVNSNLLFCWLPKAPKWNWEIKQWKRDEKTQKEIEKHNHCMSNLRYFSANVKWVKPSSQQNSPPPQVKLPRRDRRAGTTTVTRISNTPQSPIGFKDRDGSVESWRRGLGEPVTTVTRRS